MIVRWVEDVEGPIGSGKWVIDGAPGLQPLVGFFESADAAARWIDRKQQQMKQRTEEP